MPVRIVQLYNADLQQLIDLQSAKTPYQELLIQRSIPLGGAEPLAVATPEDIVVLKLLAFRDKDQDDLRQLVRRQPFDWDYVEQWAEFWQVTDQLDMLRKQIASGAESGSSSGGVDVYG